MEKSINELSEEEVKAVWSDYLFPSPVVPRLVGVQDLADSSVYQRLQNRPVKDAFRARLFASLRSAWVQTRGEGTALELEHYLSHLLNICRTDGAVTFIGLDEHFGLFVEEYTAALADTGSTGLLHTYCDLRNHIELLTNPALNEALLHPLLLLILAEALGSPPCLVDARAKDAEPMSVLAQDNMLHIDNTPFNDEYKVLVTWERGSTRGPSGQNFVFLPGTHVGVRPVTGVGAKAWSTENASIFITRERIKEAFAFQATVRDDHRPCVVEIEDSRGVLTSVFAAGSLLHHRYRTNSGRPRSCVILAFHPMSVKRRSFVPAGVVKPSTRLVEIVLGLGSTTDDDFIDAMAEQSEAIASTLIDLSTEIGPRFLLSAKERSLSEQDIDKWLSHATSAPSIEMIKWARWPEGIGSLVRSDFYDFICESMLIDKHGPLDLILYADSREEIRKWARNRIREMRASHLRARMADWIVPGLPVVQGTLETTASIQGIAATLVQLAGTYDYVNFSLADRPELIDAKLIYGSLSQLVQDLSEALRRAETPQSVVSTSLFLFWAAEEMYRWSGARDEVLKELSSRLLTHYVALVMAWWKLPPDNRRSTV